MTKFSANLGFLWADQPLPAAIRAAKAAGFVAVECHWPYDTPPTDVKAALDDTGLPMLGLNTDRGDVAGGENGLSALPSRETEARAAIMQSVEYAQSVGAQAIHVMAGNTSDAAAHATFIKNLKFATELAAPHGITILIEPLNRFDAPHYFLRTTEQAESIIKEIAAPNLKLMFDCYHVGRTEGDVVERLHALLPLIGHIQFASVPDRGTPDHGDVDYAQVFGEIAKMGWQTPLGAEYKPIGDTHSTLEWIAKFS
jgi:hydroxypyruvate isomerase